MADFTRITVVGEKKTAELVVASDQPFAALLPKFLEILGQGTPSAPLALVSVVGAEIDMARDCAAQEVRDGEILRIVPRSETPPPPIVSDVTDAVAGRVSARTNAWGDSVRTWLGAVMTGIAVWVIAAAMPHTASPSWTIGFSGTFVLILALGTFVGRRGHRPVAVISTFAACGLCWPVSSGLAALFPPGLQPGMVWVMFMLVAWVAIGVGFGLAARIRSAVIGSVFCGGYGLILAVLLAVGVDQMRVWAVGAVVGVFLVSVLPLWALSASGLTGLDDQTPAGAVPRERVFADIDDAFQAMTWSLVGVCVTVTVCVIVVFPGNRWAQALCVMSLVVLALRARTFTAPVQVSSLCLAVLVGSIAGCLGIADPVWRTIALAALLLVAIVVGGFRFPDHVRVRFNRIADMAEALCVAGLLPVLVGFFGVYSYLLKVFT